MRFLQFCNCAECCGATKNFDLSRKRLGSFLYCINVQELLCIESSVWMSEGRKWTFTHLLEVCDWRSELCDEVCSHTFLLTSILFWDFFSPFWTQIFPHCFINETTDVGTVLTSLGWSFFFFVLFFLDQLSRASKGKRKDPTQFVMRAH